MLDWRIMTPDEKLDEMRKDLEWAISKVKELRQWKDDTDERIKKIMDHSNGVAKQMEALEKMVKQLG
jgi:hypothetical protein